MSSQTDINKVFFIHTLGCKVNQYESQVMRELLLKSGFKECLSKEMASIYVVNTCTVTQHADKESRHWIGLFHKTNPKAKIVVTGCYADRHPEELSFLPGISNILKNSQKSRIAEILENPSASSENTHDFKSHPFPKITDFKDHTKAFVKIQDGCENSCSYCAVPLVRSVLKSKPVGDIVDEVSGLVKKGFREIVLTGICLGAWGKDLFPAQAAKDVGLDEAHLVDVLRALDRMPSDFRIRLSSIEARYITGELIDLMLKSRKMCRHLHIPLQSGDDEVLKRMNRPYACASYKALVDNIRMKIRDIAITTDVLIGFPGESDDNFRNTLNFVKMILPSRTHIFTFSKRKDTAAYAMLGDVERTVLKKRYHELYAASLSASYLYRIGFLNERLDVLVEGKRDKHTGLLTGYSGNYIKMLFAGADDLMRQIVPVRVEDVSLLNTFGAYDKR